MTNVVIFDLGNFGADAVSFKQVRIAPSVDSFPRVEGVTVYGVDYGYKQTDANGRLTNSMVSGSYKITFTNRFLATTFQITVPTTNASGSLYASELTTSGTNLPGNLVAYSQSASDGLFAKRTNALQSISTNGTPMFTNGVTNVNWTTGVTGYVSGATANLGVSASGGGSGDAGGTNSRQGGSLNLTNWSNIPTGAMANVPAVNFLSNEVANAHVTNAAQTVLISSNTLVINNASNRSWTADNWNSNRVDAAVTNTGNATLATVGITTLLNVNSALTLGFLLSGIPATDVDGVVGSLSYSTGLSYDGTTRTLSLSDVLQNLHSTGSNNVDYVTSIAGKQSGTFLLTNLLAMGISNIVTVAGLSSGIGTNGGVLWITNNDTRVQQLTNVSGNLTWNGSQLGTTTTNGTAITTASVAGGVVTLQAGNRLVFLDASAALTLTAIMGYAANRGDEITVILTNRTATPRNLTLGAVTNNFIPIGNITSPIPITNGLHLSFRTLGGTNVEYSAAYMANPTN